MVAPRALANEGALGVRKVGQGRERRKGDEAAREEECADAGLETCGAERKGGREWVQERRRQGESGSALTSDGQADLIVHATDEECDEGQHDVVHELENRHEHHQRGSNRR